MRNFLSFEKDLPGGLVIELEQRAAAGGFAAAGFAHQAQRLAGADIKGYVVHRFQSAFAAGGKVFTEVFHLYHIFAHYLPSLS